MRQPQRESITSVMCCHVTSCVAFVNGSQSVLFASAWLVAGVILVFLGAILLPLPPLLAALVTGLSCPAGD